MRKLSRGSFSLSAKCQISIEQEAWVRTTVKNMNLVDLKLDWASGAIQKLLDQDPSEGIRACPIKEKDAKYEVSESGG